MKGLVGVFKFNEFNLKLERAKKKLFVSFKINTKPMENTLLEMINNVS
jgi:hypothetical protein